MRYKIIECKNVKPDKTVERKWYEVQYLSNARTWWFFGERIWKTYNWGNPFYVSMKFSDITEAKEFIIKCEQEYTTIIKKEICEVLGK